MCLEVSDGNSRGLDAILPHAGSELNSVTGSSTGGRSPKGSNNSSLATLDGAWTCLRVLGALGFLKNSKVEWFGCLGVYIGFRRFGVLRFWVQGVGTKRLGSMPRLAFLRLFLKKGHEKGS